MTVKMRVMTHEMKKVPIPVPERAMRSVEENSVKNRNRHYYNIFVSM